MKAKKFFEGVTACAFFFSMMMLGGEMDRLGENDGSYTTLGYLIVAMIATLIVLKGLQHGNDNRCSD